METMGEELDGDVMGDDLDGDVMGYSTVGAARRRAVARLPAKPGWRHGIATNGVNLPRPGLEPLPMVPNVANGQFDATNVGAIITHSARPQRPFRGERLLVFVARVADAGVVPPGMVMTSGVFVGTQLQQLQIGEINLETYGPGAFGVRHAHSPAAPGIDINIGTRLTVAPTGTQKVQVSIQILGSTLGN